MYSGSTVRWMCGNFRCYNFKFVVKIWQYSTLVFSHIKYCKTHKKYISKCRISSSFRCVNLFFRNMHSFHHNMYICKECWYQKTKNHILHKLYTAVEREYTKFYESIFLYIQRRSFWLSNVLSGVKIVSWQVPRWIYRRLVVLAKMYHICVHTNIHIMELYSYNLFIIFYPLNPDLRPKDK